MLAKRIDVLSARNGGFSHRLRSPTEVPYGQRLPENPWPAAELRVGPQEARGLGTIGGRDRIVLGTRLCYD